MYFYLHRRLLTTLSVTFIVSLLACDVDSSSAIDNTTSEPIPLDTLYRSIDVPISEGIWIQVNDTSNFTTKFEPHSSSSSNSDVVLTSSTISVSSTDSQISTDSKLLWSDDFEGIKLDTTKWSYNIGTGDNGWGNSEKEYYTNRIENIYVKDGILHIRAQKEDYENFKYTSARIHTKNKFAFTYGTIEARISLPVGGGIWPAFWMLGENIDNVNWPTCGEIDIIESINDEHIVYGTHHWSHEGTHAEYGNSTVNHHGASIKLDIRDFHNYKMTWDNEFIRMFVDDFKYQEIDIKDTSSDMKTFHKPFFFILNVAIGGNWPGFDIDDSQFPSEMQIDYIRIYKN